MFVVPNFPHLRGIEMEVKYRELQLPQTFAAFGQATPIKWKMDPGTDPNQTWAPPSKFYLNGNLVRFAEPGMTPLSKEAPPEDRFPRREGITRVYPGELDYEECCRKQGLYHLIPGYQASQTSTANPQMIDTTHQHINGITPPRSDKSRSINGGSPLHLQAPLPLPNGTHEQEASPTPLV